MLGCSEHVRGVRFARFARLNHQSHKTHEQVPAGMVWRALRPQPHQLGAIERCTNAHRAMAQLMAHARHTELAQRSLSAKPTAPVHQQAVLPLCSPTVGQGGQWHMRLLSS